MLLIYRYSLHLVLLDKLEYSFIWPLISLFIIINSFRFVTYFKHYCLAQAKCEADITQNLQNSALYREDENLQRLVDQWSLATKKLELLMEELVIVRYFLL